MAKDTNYIIYKPFGMMSQFTKENDRPTLADFNFDETDVYPVGRLDADSEGLLIISNNKSLNQAILNPNSGIIKTYWVQVEGEINKEQQRKLEQGGISIKVNKKTHICEPATVQVIEPQNIPDRNPPIRERKTIPTQWLSIQIEEGKNRQVRKMTAAVGLPTLRLIRVGVGRLTITDQLESGMVLKMGSKELKHLLF